MYESRDNRRGIERRPGLVYGPGLAESPARKWLPPRARGSGATRLWVSLTAGMIGALLVLLLMPVLFGVNPYDLVRGRLQSGGREGSYAGNRARTVISPSQGGLSVAAIAEEVVPSIVNIDVRGVSSTSPFMAPESTEGTGSGVIYTTDGYIITNEHLLEDAREITVTLASGESVRGRKVGGDARSDVAVVKIDRNGLPAATLGDSDELVVGELAVAIGSPFGFEKTVTSGIVSALDRTVTETSPSSGQTTRFSGLIQTDAPINPGNSGGALCEGKGKVIGINAIIASASGGSQGVGFAIPINRVKSVVRELTGKVSASSR